MDGNILLPFDSSPSNELGQLALTGQSNTHSVSKWQKLFDKCEPTEETVYVTQKPTQTKDVQAQTKREVQPVGVCETNTASKWAKLFSNRPVSKLSEKQSSTLGMPVIRGSNVNNDIQNNGNWNTDMTMETHQIEPSDRTDRIVGQLRDGKPRRGKPASQQYVQNGKLCSGKPLPQLSDWISSTHDTRPSGEVQPPNLSPPSTQMIAPNGINSRGRMVWWEEVQLQVVGRGKKPYPLPTPPSEACVLVPSVNQAIIQKGIMVDRVSWSRRECHILTIS